MLDLEKRKNGRLFATRSQKLLESTVVVRGGVSEVAAMSDWNQSRGLDHTLPHCSRHQTRRRQLPCPRAASSRCDLSVRC